MNAVFTYPTHRVYCVEMKNAPHIISYAINIYIYVVYVYTHRVICRRYDIILYYAYTIYYVL